MATMHGGIRALGSFVRCAEREPARRTPFTSELVHLEARHDARSLEVAYVEFDLSQRIAMYRLNAFRCTARLVLFGVSYGMPILPDGH